MQVGGPSKENSILGQSQAADRDTCTKTSTKVVTVLKERLRQLLLKLSKMKLLSFPVILLSIWAYTSQAVIGELRVFHFSVKFNYLHLLTIDIIQIAKNRFPLHSIPNTRSN